MPGCLPQWTTNQGQELSVFTFIFVTAGSTSGTSEPLVDVAWINGWEISFKWIRVSTRLPRTVLPKHFQIRAHNTIEKRMGSLLLPETDAAGPNQAGELMEHHFPAPKPGGTPPKLRSSGLEHRIWQLKSQPPTFASLFTLSSSGNSHELKVRFHFNNREGSMFDPLVGAIRGAGSSVLSAMQRLASNALVFLPSYKEELMIPALATLWDGC